ncbi:MAG: type I CRISPR-associated protein Cas7 [Saccharolobus sp.]
MVEEEKVLMDIDDRKEFVFYYESKQNPNGDPGFENQPRQLSDGRIFVTDVRLKRTIRDYAKDYYAKNGEGLKIFVDYNEEGEPETADKRFKELLGGPSKNNRENASKILEKCFDVPLFGVLIPMRSSGSKKKEKNKNADEEAVEEGEINKGSSLKVVGPVQFGIAVSINKPHILAPTISSRFVGKENKENEKQFGTFGKFYSVDYALIKAYGAVNPNNVREYLSDPKDFKRIFSDREKLLPMFLWNGTNNLVTRSKYPQKSILYIEVVYKNGYLFNDLHSLIKENLKSGEERELKEFRSDMLDFGDLYKALEIRKPIIKRVRIKCSDKIKNEQKDALKTKLIQILGEDRVIWEEESKSN